MSRGVYRFRSRSETPIEVMLPVAEKDVSMIPAVVNGIRRKVMHPIRRVTIVGSRNGSCGKVAVQAGCAFIDEAEVLPIDKASIVYRSKGFDRSGWLYQQLLKISFASCSLERYCLVCDADTVFASRQSLVLGGRVLFHYSDELHLPYRRSIADLLGRKLSHPVSFVSHHALFDREIVKSMIDEIERERREPWHAAIVALADPDEPSVFSEYELYGYYFAATAPKRVAVQYWHNLAFPRAQRRRGMTIAALACGFVKTVSFHDYPEATGESVAPGIVARTDWR